MSPSATCVSTGCQHHHHTHYNYFIPHHHHVSTTSEDPTQRQQHRPLNYENPTIPSNTPGLQAQHVTTRTHLSPRHSPKLALFHGADHRLDPGVLDSEERSRCVSGRSPSLPKSPFSTSESDRGESPDPREEPTSPAPLSLVCRWTRCCRKFSSQRELAAHVNDDHVRIEQPDTDFRCRWKGCPRQGRGFNARYKMLIHIRTHTNEKPHKCGVCDKCFSRLENLKIHTRSHTGEKPYACTFPGCGKAYSNSSDRFKHVRTHQEEKPYKCKLPGCRKQYTDPSSLRKHVRTHRHHLAGEDGPDFLYSGTARGNGELFPGEDTKQCLSPLSPNSNSLFFTSQLRHDSCSPEPRGSLHVVHDVDFKSTGSAGNRTVPSLSDDKSDLEEESDYRYEASESSEAKVSNRTEFDAQQHAEVPNKIGFNIPQIVINSDCAPTEEHASVELSALRNTKLVKTAVDNYGGSRDSMKASPTAAKTSVSVLPSLKRPLGSREASTSPHKGHWKKLCIMKSESEEQKEPVPPKVVEEVSGKFVTSSPTPFQTCPLESETTPRPSFQACKTPNTPISPGPPNPNPPSFRYHKDITHNEDVLSASLLTTGRPSAFTAVHTASQRHLSVPPHHLTKSTSPSLSVVPSSPPSIPSPSMPPSPPEFYSFPTYPHVTPITPHFSSCPNLAQHNPRHFASYLKHDNLLTLTSHPAPDDVFLRHLPRVSSLGDVPTSGFSLAAGASCLGLLYPDVPVDLSQYHCYFGLDVPRLPYHRVSTV